LNQPAAVPVDTHVWDIAVRDYDPTLTDVKSLTPKVYERVGDIFRSRFGDKAGWAHSLLFAAELPSYNKYLPQSLRDDMVNFSRFQSQIKLEKKRKRENMKPMIEE
jgi:N-glycosylase/DNA lyase